MKRYVDVDKKIVGLFLGLLILSNLFVALVSWNAGASFSGPQGDLPKYFEAPFPCSYVVDTNETHTFCFNGTTWQTVESSSSNRSLPIQNAIDTLTSDGGLIFVRSGNYSDANVTVTNNVVLVLEAGITGLIYQTTGTGIALKYSGGYVWVDAPLNMTGHQILNGVFHTGTSFPSSPLEGQPFYRTDQHEFYVYNGTGWEAPAGQGAQGPAGIVQGLDYTYMAFKNSTATYMVNGTNGQIVWSDSDSDVVIDAVFNNLTSGRDFYELVVLKGDFDVDDTLHIPSYTEVYIDGKIARTSDVSILAVDEKKGQDAKSQRITVYGGILDGGGASYTSSVVQVWNLAGGRWLDMSFINFNGDGFYLSADDAGGDPPSSAFKTFYNHFVRISFGYISGTVVADSAFFHLVHAIDCYFDDCWGSDYGTTNRHIGFYSPNGWGGIRASRCHFDHVDHFVYMAGAGNQNGMMLENCIIDCTQEHGIYLEAGTNGLVDVIISDCFFIYDFEADNTYSLIYINNDGDGYLNDWQIKGCTSMDRGNDHKYCIELSYTSLNGRHCNRFQVTGNTWSAGDSGIYQYCKPQWFSEDQIYITYDWGSSSVAHQGWVAHSLATTPTVVLLTVRVNVTVWCSGRNSTHFQVSYSDSGSHTVDWEVTIRAPYPQ